jgi:hypothetical protein
MVSFETLKVRIERLKMLNFKFQPCKCLLEANIITAHKLSLKYTFYG